MRYSIQNATIEQVKAVGGSNIRGTSIGIIFATLSQEQADRLKSQGATLSIVGGVKAGIFPPVISPPAPVAAIPTFTAGQLAWAIGMEDLRKITTPPIYGEGMVLAVIGTGIRETHERIRGRVIYSKNYTTDPMRDGLDHDTGVCSIILTLAPLANILNLKVLNDKGEGTEEDVVLAIDDCITLYDTNSDKAPSVINLSLGAPDDGNPNNILRVACRAAIERKIYVLASAGNSGPAPYSITCPATEADVIAIGSAKYLPEESSFIISSFSSRGPTLEGLVKPDGVMIGENIEIASSVSDTATIAKSGTSFSTPFCSALILLYQQAVLLLIPYTLPGYPIPTPEVLAREYIATPKEMIGRFLPGVCTKPVGIVAGKDTDYGNGIPIGSLVVKALIAAPAMDVPTMLQSIMPLIGLVMMGMIITPLLKEKK